MFYDPRKVGIATEKILKKFNYLHLFLKLLTDPESSISFWLFKKTERFFIFFGKSIRKKTNIFSCVKKLLVFEKLYLKTENSVEKAVFFSVENHEIVNEFSKRCKSFGRR